MSNRDRRLISISLNVEQQRELACAMDHMATDKPTVLYRILVKRYIKENDLHPEDDRYKTQAEIIKETIGEY